MEVGEACDTIISLTIKSLLNRKVTAILTVLSIALSVSLLIGVERLRTEAKNSFANTISGTDLIVGARSGPVQLLLFSVFHIGNATNNISWKSYRDIATRPEIAWTIPISLGDSHRGYRVMGTSSDFFSHFQFGGNLRPELAKGKVFDELFDVVLGAEVAEKLGYSLGNKIVLAHGAGKVSFISHDDKPFTVAGILRRTGTPVDGTLLVSLEAIEAIHIDWREGSPVKGHSLSVERVKQMNLPPKAITSFYVGLKSRIAVFAVQRVVNQFREEPLLAILPGVALQELWNLIGVAESGLLIVSWFVVVVGLSAMLIALLTSLNERRREMAVLRSVGARPLHVFGLVLAESMVLTIAGVLLGCLLLYSKLIFFRPFILSEFGILMHIGWFSVHELRLLGIVCLAGCLIGLIPGYRSYRYSLADGMTIRV
jgi:putative ABC transport system permease protein